MASTRIAASPGHPTRALRARKGEPGRATMLVAMILGLLLGASPGVAQDETVVQDRGSAPAAAAPSAVEAAQAQAVGEERAVPDAGPVADAGGDAALPDVEPVEEGAFSHQDLQALTAPIALYPDLVLVLTLQASLAPLDIVQAQRFLEAYAEDPTLEPDPDWDESVIGLLNYPSVVRRMSEDLDWTAQLGEAVITQLGGVQDAIQEIRNFMHAIGGLQSDDKVTVIVEGDIIRIQPTDENAVFIPQYEPAALLAAFYGTGAEDLGAEAVETEAAPEELATEELESEELVEEARVETTAPEATSSEPVAAAPVATVPAYYPAVAPPPVTYSDPSPSWLGTAATFAGGAVVGGVIGYAIGDDDDDDDDGGYRYSSSIDRDINIEDSNIVINRPDDRGSELKKQAEIERLKRDAREKKQREETRQQLQRGFSGNQPRSASSSARSTRPTQASGLATSRPPAGRKATARGGREVTAREAGASQERATRTAAVQPRSAKPSTKAVRPGDHKAPEAASAFGTRKSPQQAKKESSRGMKSRLGAEVKPGKSKSGGGAFAQQAGGGKSARSADRDRGKKSRRGKG